MVDIGRTIQVGILTRREFMRRVALIGGGSAMALTLSEEAHRLLEGNEALGKIILEPTVKSEK